MRAHEGQSFSRDGAWAQFANKNWPREEINPYRQWTFAHVPLWLLEQPDVSPGAKLLYGRLVTHAGRNGKAYPNQTTLAAELGISDRQVRRLVGELETLRLLEAKKRGYGGPDCYVFLRHPWMDMGLGSNFDMPARRDAASRRRKEERV